MLATVFQSNSGNDNVNRCVSHMLQRMDYNKYRENLAFLEKNPLSVRKFVVFEYTHSAYESILQSEYVPGTRVMIHNIIPNKEFRANVRRLFGDVICYTRRKLDYSKPEGEQFTTTRQLVILIKNRYPPEDDMPPLIPQNDTFVNAEEDEMPPLVPMNNVVLNPEDELTNERILNTAQYIPNNLYNNNTAYNMAYNWNFSPLING